MNVTQVSTTADEKALWSCNEFDWQERLVTSHILLWSVHAVHAVLFKLARETSRFRVQNAGERFRKNLDYLRNDWSHESMPAWFHASTCRNFQVGHVHITGQMYTLLKGSVAWHLIQAWPDATIDRGGKSTSSLPLYLHDGVGRVAGKRWCAWCIPLASGNSWRQQPLTSRGCPGTDNFSDFDHKDDCQTNCQLFLLSRVAGCFMMVDTRTKQDVQAVRLPFLLHC